MLATKGEKPLVVKYLLENNVDTSLKNIKSKTAMDIAYKSKKKSVIDLLSAESTID